VHSLLQLSGRIGLGLSGRFVATLMFLMVGGRSGYSSLYLGKHPRFQALAA
jgi:hypothetical protein